MQEMTLSVVEYTPTRLTIEVPSGFDLWSGPGTYYLRHQAKDLGVTVQMRGDASEGDQPYTGSKTVTSLLARPIHKYEWAGDEQDPQIQVFSVTWSDGRTFHLPSCPIKPLVPVGPDERTWKEKKSGRYKEVRANRIRGLVNAGEYWNATPLNGLEWEVVARYENMELRKAVHPKHGDIYRECGYWDILYAPHALVEECYRLYAEQQYWVEGYHTGAKPGPVSREESDAFLNAHRHSLAETGHGIGGAAFHKWNVWRAGEL